MVNGLGQPVHQLRRCVVRDVRRRGLCRWCASTTATWGCPALRRALPGRSASRASATAVGDMAADGIAVLDALGVARGARHGSVDGRDDRPDHGDRASRACADVTSVMSTTGEAEYGAAAAGRVRTAHRAAGHRPRRRTCRTPSPGCACGAAPSSPTRPAGAPMPRPRFDRCFDPSGTTRQFLAIRARGSRADSCGRDDTRRW